MGCLQTTLLYGPTCSVRSGVTAMITEASYSDNLRPALACVNNRPQRTSRWPERRMIHRPDGSLALYHVNWGVRSTAHSRPSLTRVPELAVPQVVTALTSPPPANKESRFGSRTLTITPQKNDPGSVDETGTYTLNATNAQHDPKKGPAPVQLAAEKEHRGN